jgi:hypothetical protein
MSDSENERERRNPSAFNNFIVLDSDIEPSDIVSETSYDTDVIAATDDERHSEQSTELVMTPIRIGGGIYPSSASEDDPYADSGSSYRPSSSSDESKSFPKVNKKYSRGIQHETEDTVTNEEKHRIMTTKSIDNHIHAAKMNEGCRIMATNNTNGRKWDKKHACLYCKKLFSKLPRHLEATHANEKEVLEAMMQPKLSKQRKQLFEKLRNMGNFIHNSTCLTTGHGIIIPKRRANSGNIKNLDEYAPCGACRGLFKKKYFYHHYNNCSERKETSTRKKGFTVFPTVDCFMEDFSSNVLANMRQDNLYQVMRQDKLILKFGAELYNKLGVQIHLRTYIAQRMRQITRLLLAVRECDKSINNLSDILHPRNYNTFVKGVQTVASFDKKTNKYGIPSLALRLRSTIMECAQIEKSHCIISENYSRRKEVDDFVSLIDMNFRNHVTSHALSTAYNAKWNRPVLLPFASDISKLSSYLKEQAAGLMEDIGQICSPETWIRLCEVSLTQTVLFNRRRSGEAERIFLKTFLNREPTLLNEDINETLTEVEKQIANNLTRFETRGKKGRKVPILLTGDMKNQIDTLCKYREHVGISRENVYLFAKMNTLSHMRAHDKLRQFSNKCGAKDPKTLTSTKLRKQVATVSQLLNLKDNEMDQLATYMGHYIRVHREFYRLPESTIQLTKISKLLLAMDSGNISKSKGRNLDTIETNDVQQYCENTSQSMSSVEDFTEDPNQYNKNSMEDFIEDTNQYDKNNIEQQVVTVSDSVSAEKDKKLTKRNDRVTSTGRKKIITKSRTPWNEREKDAINRQMAVFWIKHKVPNKKECDECLRKEPALQARPWIQIKSYVHNLIQKNKKNRK